MNIDFLKDIHVAETESEIAIDLAISDLYTSCYTGKPTVVFADNEDTYTQSIEKMDNILLTKIGSFIFYVVFALIFVFLLVWLDTVIWNNYYHKEGNSLILGLILFDFVFFLCIGILVNKFYIEYTKNQGLKRIFEKIPSLATAKINAPTNIVGSLMSAINSITEEPVSVLNFIAPRSIWSSGLTWGDLSWNNPRGPFMDISKFIFQNKETSRYPLILKKATNLANMVDYILMFENIVFVLPKGTLKVKHDKVLQDFVQKIEEAKSSPETVMSWNITERGKFIDHYGAGEFINKLNIQPSITDETGSLYRIGQASDVNCYVKVLDKVQDQGGNHLVHWISVPQHILTPHEGIAWSFGLIDEEYRPTAET